MRNVAMARRSVASTSSAPTRAQRPVHATGGEPMGAVLSSSRLLVLKFIVAHLRRSSPVGKQAAQDIVPHDPAAPCRPRRSKSRPGSHHGPGFPSSSPAACGVPFPRPFAPGSHDVHGHVSEVVIVQTARSVSCRKPEHACRDSVWRHTRSASNTPPADSRHAGASLPAGACPILCSRHCQFLAGASRRSSESALPRAPPCFDVFIVKMGAAFHEGHPAIAHK